MVAPGDAVPGDVLGVPLPCGFWAPVGGLTEPVGGATEPVAGVPEPGGVLGWVLGWPLVDPPAGRPADCAAAQLPQASTADNNAILLVDILNPPKAFILERQQFLL